jgi:hypothetical protein
MCTHCRQAPMPRADENPINFRRRRTRGDLRSAVAAASVSMMEVENDPGQREAFRAAISAMEALYRHLTPTSEVKS